MAPESVESPLLPPPEPGLPPATFAVTWRRVVTEPSAFFAGLPDVEPLGPAMRFLAITAALDGAGALLVHWSVAAGLMAAAGVLAGAVLVAALATLVAQQVLEGRAGFDPTLRGIAYAAAPLVFAWLPGVGGLTVPWAGYLAVRAVARMQGFDGLRALVTIVASVAALALVRSGSCG